MDNIKGLPAEPLEIISSQEGVRRVAHVVGLKLSDSDIAIIADDADDEVKQRDPAYGADN